MTEPRERPALPADLLADLDAGLLDPARAAEVRAAAAQDPDATAVLAGLATTRAELGELADPPLPEQYAARWDAALAAEALPRAGTRSRRRRVRPALVAAAVLAATVVAGLLWTPRDPAPMSLDGVDPVAAALTVRGDFDVGELADPATRAGCLRTVAPPGVSPEAQLLGGRDVVLDGRDGVLLLMATGERGRLHVVVVAPGCGPGGGVLLDARTIGG
jgi:anti-sigma factor RsiW